jgi:hypothetical protein
MQVDQFAPLAHSQPVTLMTQLIAEALVAQKTAPQLQDLIAAVRPT